MFRQSNGYSFKIDENIFFSQMKNNWVSLNYNSIGSNGSSSNFSLQNSLLGSIGEAFERQELTAVYDNVDLFSNINCIDLIDYNVKQIPLNNDTFKYFSDTTGLATHLTSKKSIYNSVSEFIERQSFVISYLSKKGRFRIEKDKWLYSIIKDEFKFLQFYDISISKSFYTVIAIGERKKGYIDLGLGTGRSVTEAIKNVLREIFPFRGKHGEIDIGDNEKVDYIHLYNKLSIEQIKAAYDYLNKLPIKSIQEYPVVETIEMQQIILELYKVYNIRPLLCSLNHLKQEYSRNSYSKITKVFAYGWFPSLNPNDYTDDIYKNVEKNTGFLLDKKVNFLPFP